MLYPLKATVLRKSIQFSAGRMLGQNRAHVHLKVLQKAPTACGATTGKGGEFPQQAYPLLEGEGRPKLLPHEVAKQNAQELEQGAYMVASEKGGYTNPILEHDWARIGYLAQQYNEGMKRKRECEASNPTYADRQFSNGIKDSDNGSADSGD